MVLKNGVIEASDKCRLLGKPRDDALDLALGIGVQTESGNRSAAGLEWGVAGGDSVERGRDESTVCLPAVEECFVAVQLGGTWIGFVNDAPRSDSDARKRIQPELEVRVPRVVEANLSPESQRLGLGRIGVERCSAKAEFLAKEPQDRICKYAALSKGRGRELRVEGRIEKPRLGRHLPDRTVNGQQEGPESCAAGAKTRQLGTV